MQIETAASLKAVNLKSWPVTSTEIQETCHDL